MLVTRIDANWFCRELKAAHRQGKRDPMGRWAALVTPLKRGYAILAIGCYSGFDLWFAGRRRIYNKAGRFVKTVNLPFPLTLD